MVVAVKMDSEKTTSTDRVFEELTEVSFELGLVCAALRLCQSKNKKEYKNNNVLENYLREFLQFLEKGDC